MFRHFIRPLSSCDSALSTFLDQRRNAHIPSLPGSTCATWPLYAVRGGKWLQKSKLYILFSFFLHSHLSLLHFSTTLLSLLFRLLRLSHSFTHTHTVFTLLYIPLHLLYTRLHPSLLDYDDLQRPLPFPPRRCRYGQSSPFYRTTQLSISRQQGDSPFDP